MLGVDPGTEPAHDLTIDLDPPGADQLLAVPPAAHARRGKHFLQADAAGHIGQRVTLTGAAGVPAVVEVVGQARLAAAAFARARSAGARAGLVARRRSAGAACYLAASWPRSSSSSRWSGRNGTRSGRSDSRASPSRSRKYPVVWNRIAPVSGSLPGFLDQSAQHQGAHDAVAVNAADGGHPGAAHRLPVGHHGQRLQRGLGEPDLLTAADEPLYHRSALGPGVQPPAASDLAQVETALLSRIGVGKLAQRSRDRRGWLLGDIGQQLLGTGSSATSSTASRLIRSPGSAAGAPVRPSRTQLARYPSYSSWS